MWGAEVPWPLVEPEVEPSLYPLCLAVWVAQGWSSGGQGGWLRGAKWAQGLELAKSCRHSGDSVSWPRRTAGRRGTALFTDPGPELQPPSARPARTRGWTQAGAVGHGRESWLRNLRDHLLDGEKAGSRQGQAGRERAFGGSQILHPWTWPRRGEASRSHSLPAAPAHPQLQPALCWAYGGWGSRVCILGWLLRAPCSALVQKLTMHKSTAQYGLHVRHHSNHFFGLELLVYCMCQ